MNNEPRFIPCGDALEKMTSIFREDVLETVSGGETMPVLASIPSFFPEQVEAAFRLEVSPPDDRP